MDFMEGIGFNWGMFTPCIFWRVEKGIRAAMHGDDFTLLGNEEALDLFKERTQDEFDVAFQGRLGPGKMMVSV